jgi:hypothetical protein
VAPAPYAWGALGIVLVLILALWMLAQPTADWPVAARLPTRLALIFAYPVLLLALRVYSIAEVRALASAAAGRLRGAR